MEEENEATVGEENDYGDKSLDKKESYREHRVCAVQSCPNPKGTY